VELPRGKSGTGLDREEKTTSESEVL